MSKFLLMLIFCVTAQRILGKTLFDYNINPQYDLVADESTSYSNFWPSSDFYVASVDRYKHHAKKGDNGKRGRGQSIHGAYPYTDSSEEYYDSDEHHGYPLYPQPPHHHSHGLPPGLAKKQNNHHPHPEPPRRFPPPPVYDPHFINPWLLPAPAPSRFPFMVQQPPLTTPGVYIAPKLTTRRTITTTTTPTPLLLPTPTSDDQSIYDIDVRFGRE